MTHPRHHPPRLVEQVLTHLRDGKTLNQTAAATGVHRSTIFKMAKRHGVAFVRSKPGRPAGAVKKPVPRVVVMDAAQEWRGRAYSLRWNAAWVGAYD